jgi:signal transduction histidine kinase
MKVKPLWSLHPLLALAIAGLLSTPWGVVLLGLSLAEPNPQYPASVILLGTGALLVTAFLARIKPERWLRHELHMVGLSVLIAGVTFSFVFLFLKSVITDRDSLLFAAVGTGLMAFSHVGVRGFAYLQHHWGRMRRRRLRWEIAHAQLRLVIAGMVLAFLVLIGFQLRSLSLYNQDGLAGVVNSMTLLVLLLGFGGVVTGVLLVLFVIPASVISYLTARSITKRIEALTEATRAIRQGMYTARTPVEGEDEIAQLQRDFNAMAADLEEANTALKAERDSVLAMLESRRRMFANISHELRTPVTTMRSLLEKREGNEMLKNEVMRMQHMIDDVFTLARTEADQLRYEITPVALLPLLKRVVEGVKGQAWQSRKVDVLLETPSNLPPTAADPERVEQILYNLLHNAIRHTMPGGFILLRVEEVGEQVCITVRDTGEGIAPDDLPHIWERFYRSAEARAADRQGAGLGLALVKEMTEAMGGTVDVKSKLGEGSVFSVQLPTYEL